MNKKVWNLIIISSILFMMMLLITNNRIVFSSTASAFDIWMNNLVPVMLPFFILTDILINYNFVYYLNRVFAKISYFLFKINPACSFIFFMSIFSGFPSNAKYISNLYHQNMITKLDASKIILFSHFSNPLFIIGTISLLLGNQMCAIIILISHYVSNIIIGLLFRNYHLNSQKTLPKAIVSKPFITILGNAIISSINTLLLILGTITFFLIISNIILEVVNTSSFTKAILIGILEMSSGSKYIAFLNTSLIIKAVMIAMILSFGGFSIHIQTFSILEDMNIKYLPYFMTRILHALIAGMLTFIILWQMGFMC